LWLVLCVVAATITPLMPSNQLYFGDNLPILISHVRDESVDLVYLDPPFNSQAAYNIIYKGSQAQIRAFGDPLEWVNS